MSVGRRPGRAEADRDRPSGPPAGVGCVLAGVLASVGHTPGIDERSRRGDGGSFTAELAAGLPALLMLFLVGLTAVSAVTAKGQCVAAAREAALASARGEPGAAAGERVAPDGAAVSVSSDGDLVRATVRVPVRAVGIDLPSLAVEGTAIAAVEPGGLDQ